MHHSVNYNTHKSCCNCRVPADELWNDMRLVSSVAGYSCRRFSCSFNLPWVRFFLSDCPSNSAAHSYERKMRSVDLNINSKRAECAQRVLTLISFSTLSLSCQLHLIEMCSDFHSVCFSSGGVPTFPWSLRPNSSSALHWGNKSISILPHYLQ